MANLPKALVRRLFLLLLAAAAGGLTVWLMLPKPPEQRARKAYLKFHEAVQDGDIKSMRNAVPAGKLAEFDAAMAAADTVAGMQRLAPRVTSIVSAQAAAGGITLQVAGESVDSQAMNATVTMIEENGEWKIAHEDWRFATVKQEPTR